LFFATLWLRNNEFREIKHRVPRSNFGVVAYCGLKPAEEMAGVDRREISEAGGMRRPLVRSLLNAGSERASLPLSGRSTPAAFRFPFTQEANCFADFFRAKLVDTQKARRSNPFPDRAEVLGICRLA